MALNNFKCNRLMPLHFDGLIINCHLEFRVSDGIDVVMLTGAGWCEDGHYTRV